MARLDRFANPTRFLKLANAVLPWAVVATVLFLVAGLYFALFDSPPDYQQGDTVRIMYIHVPSAWLGMSGYVAMAVAAGAGLIWKHPLGDLAAKACAPIGAAFTLIALVTGSLWGKPMWGAYWVWDARLTSMLILFFLYLGYMALVNAFDDPSRGARAGAILALVGVINIPIIKWSVDWWNTLHQGSSVFRLGGPTIAASMLMPLLLMTLAFHALFLVAFLLRVRGEILAMRIRNLRLVQVRG